MRVIIRRTDIIKIGRNFVTSATPGEDIVPMLNMNLSFGVNIPALLKRGGTSIRVSVYDQEIHLGTRSFVAQLVGDSLISSTVNESQEKERITRTRDELCLYKANIDVTKFIANDAAKASSPDKKNVVEYVSILDRNTRDKGVNISPETPDSSAVQANEAFMRNLVNAGIDPATVYTPFPVIDPSGMRKVNSTERNETPITDETRRVVRVYSLVGRPSVYRKSAVKTSYYEVRHTIQMPYSKVSQVSKLYFHLEALGTGESSIDYEVVQFDTRQMVADVDRYKANTENVAEPGLTTVSTEYTRNVYPPRSTRLSYYSPGAVSEERTSNYSFGYPVILRATTAIRNSMSTKFMGRVILRNNPVTRSAQQGSNEIPFYINRSGDNLLIKVPKVPAGVISVQLQRRESYKRENYSNLGSPQLVILGDTITLVDTGLRESITYEYRLSFVDNRSNVKHSSNTLLYHYVSSSLSPACYLTISDVLKSTVATSIGNVPTVRITVDSGTVEQGVQGTKEFLQSQGVDTTLIGDLINDSASYKQLPIYEVLRFNVRTGELESLGKFVNNDILDDSAVPGGVVKGVEPLSFFESYRYVVKLGLRSPSALSTSQRSTAIDPNTGKTYSYNSYKYRSRRFNTDLPSSQEMAQLASTSVTEVNIDTIDVGVESAVNVGFDEFQPRIVNLSARRTFVKTNLLTWKVSGDSRLIDHYQIYAEADGVNALVGCAHPFTSDGDYKFEDTQMYDRVGVVTYNVVPVKLDFTRALGDAKVSVVKESTLLDFLRE